MKILIIVVLVVLYAITTVYLYKTYEKNDKFSAKLTEIVAIETLGYVFLGLILLNPNKEYNLVSMIDILQWVSFFCLFFFLFYFDYGTEQTEEKEKAKELRSKKDIFLHFMKKSGKSNLVLTKNKKFVFFLAVYIILEIVKIIVERI